MKLFEFSGAETDWVVAKDEEEARDTLMRHYGISASDIDGSYESVSEVDPDKVEFYTDKTDEETGETIMEVATHRMDAAERAGRTGPWVLGSTYE
jgi:hypothetical protein